MLEVCWLASDVKDQLRLGNRLDHGHCLYTDHYPYLVPYYKLHIIIRSEVPNQAILVRTYNDHGLIAPVRYSKVCPVQDLEFALPWYIGSADVVPAHT